MAFEEKVVLVTGAASGIGASTSIHFSKLGAKLVLVDKNPTSLTRIALYCEKAKGVKPLVIAADISQDDDVKKTMGETIDHFGMLDVLINNAATMSVGGIKQGSIEKFDSDMETNIRGVYHLTMLAVPELIKTKGNIINVSSIEGQKPNLNSLTYSLTKAALDQFTKCLALELAPDGVRVNSVNPGFVRTNMMKNLGLTETQLEHFMTNMESRKPLKISTEATEVAALIEFLAGNNARSITGALHLIDGGSSLC